MAVHYSSWRHVSLCLVLHVLCTVAESWECTNSYTVDPQGSLLKRGFKRAVMINTAVLCVFLCWEWDVWMCQDASVFGLKCSCPLYVGLWDALLCIKRDLKCACISETAALLSLKGIPTIHIFIHVTHLTISEAIHPTLSIHPSSTHPFV